MEIEFLYCGLYYYSQSLCVKTLSFGCCYGVEVEHAIGAVVLQILCLFLLA